VSVPRPPLRLVEGGQGARPGLAVALEFAALGLGLTTVVALMAASPPWFWDLGRFQALYLVAFAFYALALLRLRRYESLPHAGGVVVAVAVAARLLLIPLPPSLSGDLYRYVWEGRVLVAGGDPYRQSPLDPALEPLREGVVWPQINHKHLSTIYPPVAEAGFAAVARVSPTVGAFKWWVGLHDIAVVLALLLWARRAGWGPASVLAYAWNPLVLVEYAGSGHNDPTAMVWLVVALALARERPAWSALALVVGCLTKLAPLAALPFLLRVWPWRARLIALALLAGGLGLFVSWTRVTYSGLAAYWGTWRNNELLFHYLDRFGGGFGAARAIGLALVLAVLAWAWWRAVSPGRGTRLLFQAGLLTSPVLHPWYLGWPLVLDLPRASWPWLVLSLTVILNYGVFAVPAEGRSFHLPLGWRWVEYGLPALLAIVLWWRERRAATGGVRH
jgi:hypothetical protein